MSSSRRRFLQGGIALAAGAVAAPRLLASAPQQATASAAAPASQAASAAVQIPKMKFGKVEIGRLVLGVNPFYGFTHFNNDYSQSMRDWYTPERVCQALHHANQFGIDAFNFVNVPRSADDLSRFQAEGGRMHLIVQTTAWDDAAQLVAKLKPLALQRRGEEVDLAFRNGTMAAEREWAKRARDLGVMVGIGTHKPEVIELCEEQGWDVDFYAGCVYNRTRTPDEWRKMLGGQLMEMPGETYVQSDPPRMFEVIRKTAKPCFAFKILAAGRIPEEGVKQAFRTAFASIKPTDGVYVGVYPRFKDEIKENAELVHGILAGA